MTRPVVALAEAFGHRGALPGLSNEHIAELIRDNYDHIHYLMVRHEIRTALKAFWILPEFTVYKHRNAAYLDTLDSIEQMVERMSAEQLRTAEIWYFCHQTHKTYVQLQLASYGIKVSRWITTSRYDRDSSQWWTRDPIRCNWCKFWRGIKYLIHGKIRLRRSGQ